GLAVGEAVGDGFGVAVAVGVVVGVAVGEDEAGGPAGGRGAPPPPPPPAGAASLGEPGCRAGAAAERATWAAKGSGTNVVPAGAPPTSALCRRMKTMDWLLKFSRVSVLTRSGAPGM